MIKGIRRKEFNSKLNKCSTRFRPFISATLKQMEDYVKPILSNGKNIMSVKNLVTCTKISHFLPSKFYQRSLFLPTNFVLFKRQPKLKMRMRKEWQKDGRWFYQLLQLLPTLKRKVTESCTPIVSIVVTAKNFTCLSVKTVLAGRQPGYPRRMSVQLYYYV